MLTVMRGEQLEARLTPTATDLGSGVVRLRSQPLFDVVAFDGWGGALNVLDTGERVYVGPGDGGAPREAVFDEATGLRLEDFFAGDPEGRSGLVFVGVGATATPATVHPSAGDPSGFPVMLDFEAEQPAEFRAAVVSDFAALLSGLPLYVTSSRPDLPPTSYATVVIGAATDFAGSQAAGSAYVGALRSGIPALVAPGYSAPLTAVFAAHEFGHEAGLLHSADPRSVMFPSPAVDAAFSGPELTAVRAALAGRP